MKAPSGSLPTAVAEGSTALLQPTGLSGLAAAPNPFNGQTTFTFTLALPATVTLAASGQRVATLAEGACASGAHLVTWDSTDQAGHALASGVYLCRLTGVGPPIVRRIALVR